MDVDRDTLEADLEKKRGQVKKAKTSLETKKKRNQRNEAKRKKYNFLLSESKKKIAEYKRLIEFHENQIEDWEKKLYEVPDDVEPVSEQARYDKVLDELKTMEMIAIEIITTLQTLEKRREKAANEEGAYTEIEWEAMSGVYRDRLAEEMQKFKSAKGRGF